METILLVFGFIVGTILLMLGLSRLYIMFGRLRENSVMAMESNGLFVGLKIASKIKDFRQGDDKTNVDYWDLKKVPGGAARNYGIFEKFGIFVIGRGSIPEWPLTEAREFVIERNSHRVVRYEESGKPLEYRLHEDPIKSKAIPLFVTHSFETAPVNTMGKVEKSDDPREKIATVLALFQVQIIIFNPYRALYMTQDFMFNVNGTLQSASREIIARVTLMELIQARTEGESKVKIREMGKNLKGVVNDSLKRYGVKIKDIDFLDFHLAHQKAEDALNQAQIEEFEANARAIRGRSEKDYDEQRAIGNAAEISEMLKAAGGNHRLVEEEIRRRGLKEIAQFGGASLSFGGNGGPSAIVDARERRDNKPNNPKKTDGDRK